ncbi:MAG: hypothetical protein HQK67_01860 [Desulfamplus sp.]|nr:hypothetical protein [Desulfamplus sp.]
MFSMDICSIISMGICSINKSVSAQESNSFAYPSAPVILTIEPALDRKPISPYLYGVNIANWGSWYYIHMLEQRLRDARVEVVRLGATNMERYNFKNNRIYNVISKKNEYISLSWESFVDWTRNSLNAEPFVQISVFGNVASDSDGIENSSYTNGEYYSHFQSQEEVMEWIESAGDKVHFWGIGNEPWIAWKRSDYPSLYADAAHGDQVLNAHISYDYYFDRFATVAKSIKAVNPHANTLGPTPANWFLYWFNDYSPLCPVTEPGGDARINDSAWQIMKAPESTFDKSIFPNRGGDPEISGWETDPEKNLPQYLKRMNTNEVNSGKRIANYLDVHRYIRCLTDYDAIQEPRGFFQKNFQSWDMETQFSGVKTNILNRLNSAIDAYYPGTLLSFSEYEYFYWDGHPSIPQITAIGNMDFLGFFARGGVSLACNWYVGEPNQSGSDLTHAQRDSAMQAMFDEEGNPNPKYWSFYMMSNFFRGTSVKAEASDWERFSVHACQNDNGDYVVFAVNKGSYSTVTGDYIRNQDFVNAVIDLSAASTVLPPATTASLGDTLHLSRLFRYGLDDPHVVEMDTTGLEMDSHGRLTFDFYPLAIYAFVFSVNEKKNEVNYLEANAQEANTQNDTAQNANVHDKTILVTPETIHFRPYDTGKTTYDDKSVFTHAIKITNTKIKSQASWSVRTDSNQPSWLTIEGSATSLDANSNSTNFNSTAFNANVSGQVAMGDASVTDSVYLTVNRSDLDPGSYETEIFVDTNGEASLGDTDEQNSTNQQNSVPVKVKIIMDVIPGEENGEKRIIDFETGSLAHTLNLIPPYSIGWWDGHGAPNDRNMPYLYDFYMDKSDVNRLGGQYCMKIEFDRNSADTETGKLYQSFGSYGHDNATADWSGYDAFEFDIKTDTVGSKKTSFLMVLSDKSGNQGKPAIAQEITGDIDITNNNMVSNNMANYSDLITIQDGPWQTITIPIDGKFFDWRYPQGQNGSETSMDFSAITQIEFVPWSGDSSKKGSIWLDNLRLVKTNDKNNHFPVAVIEKKNILILPGESVTLDGSKSYDPDHNGGISGYRWIPADNFSNMTNLSNMANLSDSLIAAPVFSSSDEGIYIYDLIVTDNDNLESRNMAQVMVTVSKTIEPDNSTISIGGGNSGQGCFIATIITSDIRPITSETFPIMSDILSITSDIFSITSDTRPITSDRHNNNTLILMLTFSIVTFLAITGAVVVRRQKWFLNRN